MSEWREYKLGQIAEIKNGKTRPKGIGSIPVYGGNGILDYCNSANVHGKTIIIGRVGAYCGAVYFEEKETWVSDNALYLKPQEGFSARYLYYLLKNENLNRYAGGSSHPLLTQSRLNELGFSLPNLSTQTAIAEILSSLDDKIELNNRINAELEALAQALFKRWFVDFDFPNENGQPYKSSGGKMVESELGEIPEGWEVKKLEDLAKITIGRTPPRNEHEWFSENIGDYKWISIKDMGNSAAYILNSSECLTAEAVAKFNIPVIEANTVILSFKLTVGRIAITTEKMVSNEAIAHLNKIDKNISTEYMYLYLKNFDFDSLGSTSSIATAVNTKSIRTIRFLYPELKLLEQFQMLLSPIFEQLLNGTRENQELTQLRDTLLPKLISGELQIN
jgi:type I restriction enzyme S subunit